MEKELSQVNFVGIYRATTRPHNFWVATLLWGYSCKAFITKKKKKKKKMTTTAKKQTKIFDKKDWPKKLVPSQREKTSGVLRLNEILSKLLTISKCLQSNCKKIRCCFVVLNMLSVFIFHILHTTWGIIDYS